jgi:hypothetical protein
MIELRGYQNECIEGIRTSIVRGFSTMACVLPTGSGKTTIFGNIISRYLDRNAGKRVVVISHLGLLTSQTASRFKSEWGVECGVLQARVMPTADDRCVITTMQSFRDETKRQQMDMGDGFWGADTDKVGLIIIDEAHFAGCNDAIVIGFTATPFRKNKLMTNLFKCVAYTCPMQRLIDEGYLVEPKLHLTPFDTTNQAEMFATMIKIYKEKHSGQKAVIYLKTIEEAKLCTQILRESGVTSRAVTSELTGDPRDELLAEFRDGKGPDVLTTVDVLTAGFDSPNLRALFIPYKVGSVTTYLQRVGRGLRPYEDKTHCDVYVGSESPGIEKGYWEDINKQMLNQGRDPSSYDNYLDIAEFAENDMSTEMYRWTMDVVNMAKEVKKLGMHGLFDQIITKQLPEDMLNIMIAEAPTTTKKNAKTPMTAAQSKYLKAFGLYADGLTKQEASAMIHAHKRSTGWEPDQKEIVQSGKHQGKHFSQVPPAYWGLLGKKYPFSPVYKQYKEWKQSIGGRV